MCLQLGDQTILDAVSFELGSGEVLGLLGPNGAGKTTLVRMVLGLAHSDTGTIRVLGKSPPERPRHSIGYLPEERGLYPKQRLLPLMRYLVSLNGVAPDEAERRSLRWLEHVGLADRARAKVGTLSKGMQQKAQLGIAHLHAPDLLILDEPFTGLDPVGRKLVSEVVALQKARGAGILISSHLLDQVEQVCDRVVMIREGRVLREGSVTQLIHAASGRVVELETEPAALALCTELLEEHPYPPGSAPRYRLREGSDPAQLLKRLGEAGYAPTHFAVHRPSLEEVFVEALDQVGAPEGASRGENSATANSAALHSKETPR